MSAGQEATRRDHSRYTRRTEGTFIRAVPVNDRSFAVSYFGRSDIGGKLSPVRPLNQSADGCQEFID